MDELTDKMNTETIMELLHIIHIKVIFVDNIQHLI